MKVSVVLPFFNAKRHLRRAADSVLAQTHRPLELFMVDDGSTDGSAAIAEEAVARAPFPAQLLRQPNRGACAARNAGLRLATGEYIQFMDADDAIAPEKIERHARAVEAHGLPDILVGSARIFGPDGRIAKLDIQATKGRDPWLDMALTRMGGTPNNLWKRSAVEAIGGWDESLRSSQEYDLLFRLLRNGATVAYDAEPLTDVHRQAAGSITSSDPVGKWRRHITLRARIIEHLVAERSPRDLAPFRQALFDAIRFLYPYDRQGALRYYNTLLPPDYMPGLSTATGWGYLLLHRLLGFGFANRVRGWLKPPPLTGLRN